MSVLFAAINSSRYALSRISLFALLLHTGSFLVQCVFISLCLKILTFCNFPCDFFCDPLVVKESVHFLIFLNFSFPFAVDFYFNSDVVGKDT